MQNIEGQGARGRLLVVDDEAAILGFLRTALEGAGYEVIAATSGMEALSKSREQNDQIDLLLTDVIMPDLNGPNLADYLLRRNSSIRVLFMSGWEPNVIAHAGALSRGFPTLMKPFAAEALLKAVDAALGEQRPGRLPDDSKIDEPPIPPAEKNVA